MIIFLDILESIVLLFMLVGSIILIIRDKKIEDKKFLQRDINYLLLTFSVILIFLGRFFHVIRLTS
jgi:Ca2+/Na+ antiporter